MSDTQPHHGKPEFFEYTAVQTPPAEDAEIFWQAAQLVPEMRPSAAIKQCGGTMQHINHFSMNVCDCRPIDPWADQQEVGIVRAEMLCVAEKLKGSTDDL